MSEAPRSHLEQLDLASQLHPFTSIASHMESGPLIMAEGDGTRLRDQRGREYLDAMAGLWCVNVGYGREEIVRAIAEQASRLSYYHAFGGAANEAAIECAAKLLELAPPGMSKVFFGTSGSDANETQIKLVWYYNNLLGRPAKKKIIGRIGGYHGSTVAAASLSGLHALHAPFDLPLERFLHVSRPHYPRDAREGQSPREFSRALAEELDARIRREGPESVAAFIAEPVMGAGGVIVPPEGYFEAIAEVLREHDVLLIADEVICGFGRLGSFWGSERFGMQPDLLTAAKGLTSGYVPMSACLISQRIWEVLREGSERTRPFAHGYTYSAHPLAAAAALANFAILEREDLVVHAAKVGAYFQRRLRDAFARHPLVGEVRGVGLLAGLELSADRARPSSAERTLGARAHALLLEEGLVVRPIGDVIALCPALILREEEVDELVERLERGLARLAKELA